MGSHLYPPDQVNRNDQDANIFVAWPQRQEKNIFSRIILRATVSRCSWVDTADKVTKRARLKLSESIWVSDLNGDFRNPARSFPLWNLASAHWDPGPLLLSPLVLVPHHLFHRSVSGAQRKTAWVQMMLPPSKILVFFESSYLHTYVVLLVIDSLTSRSKTCYTVCFSEANVRLGYQDR